LSKTVAVVVEEEAALSLYQVIELIRLSPSTEFGQN